jgi:hypothetical protein
MKPTRRYFLRASRMRETLVVVLPLFCPVAAMKIFRAMRSSERLFKKEYRVWFLFEYTRK